MTNTSKIKLQEDNGNDSKSDVSMPISPFVTTTDVINQLNKQLSNLSSEYGDNGNSDISTLSKKEPCFELQKRLPDGSAIPATQEEAAAADFKTKLEQSAKFVSQLKKSDRQYWAEQQRLTGNEFFERGDYKGAMDVYLTCLVVKENTPDFVRDTFFPILNNLSQCCLQLGMHKKTIVFCKMALKEVSKIEDLEHITVQKRNPVDSIALCKIYFKLAKALRLTGDYGEGRNALNHSSDCLIEKEREFTIASITTNNDDDDDDDAKITLLPYQKAIKKEYRYLDIAEKEARRNRARQKRAMQSVLSSSASSSKYSDGSNMPLSSPPLYEDHLKPREYSRLRIRKNKSSLSTSKGKSNPNSNISVSHSHKPSYSQYYWSMVARVANYLLLILGDEDMNVKEGPND